MTFSAFACIVALTVSKSAIYTKVRCAISCCLAVTY
nr:MAG TPA: hypothetical protein [Bacteriophage sp.]